MKFSKVLLRESADPNANPGTALGSARILGITIETNKEGQEVRKGHDLELDPTGGWVIVDGTYAIPREMVRHSVIAKDSKAKR